MINRRQWLCGVGIMTGAAAQSGRGSMVSGGKSENTQHQSLELSEFVAKSMLQIRESNVSHSRFPVIDIHTHITQSAKSQRGVSLSSDRKYLGTPEELLAVMDSKSIQAMVRVSFDGDWKNQRRVNRCSGEIF